MGVIFFRTFFSLAFFLAGDPESQRWHGTLAAELASRPRHQARACPLLTINVFFDHNHPCKTTLALCSLNQVCPGYAMDNGRNGTGLYLLFSCVEIES